MIVASGRVRLLVSKVLETLRAASNMASTRRSEPGGIDYRFAIDVDDPLTIQQVIRYFGCKRSVVYSFHLWNTASDHPLDTNE